jgi:hypothetical protein
MLKNRGKRTVVWIWGGFSALLVFIVVVLVVVTSSMERKWRDMETFLDKVRLERITRTHVRIVAGGKPLPGNAWDEYSLAEEKATRFIREKALTDFLDTGADSPQLRNILARGEGALDHLHRGAQRSNGQYPYRWNVDDGDIPLISRRQGLALFATTKARVFREQGRVREAAGVLVDVLTYTGDSGRNASLISAAIALNTYPRTLDETQLVIDSGKLDREGMAQLAADLEALDRDFPRIGPAFVSEALSSGLVVRKHGGMPPLFPPKTLWNRAGVKLANGFWARGLWADAVMEVGGYMQRIEALDNAPFAVSLTEASRINAEAKASTNPMTRALFPLVTGYATQQRAILARLRLLRSAATYRATGQVPELDDPLGGKLFHKQENGKLKLWSVGSDGKNDGGVKDENLTDIVLEVTP